MTTQEGRLTAHTPERLHPVTRVRLGGDEAAICAVIGLSPDVNGQDPNVNMVLLDVGFRGESGKYGPYDLVGSGEKRTFAKSYVLVRKETAETGSRIHYQELEPDEELELGKSGRIATAMGYANDPNISRNHAKLRIGRDGAVTVEDEGSLNGTVVSSAERVLGQVDTEFNYTFNIHDVVSQAGKSTQLTPENTEQGWGYGVYSGRPIIARDTPINGGVYPVGGKTGEALVIDDRKYPEPLSRVYDAVTAQLNPKRLEGTALGGLKKLLGKRQIVAPGETEGTLRLVFGVVSEFLKYDLEATNSIAQNYQKVSLGVYIEEGVGVCRTQAALTAYVVERLINEGRLAGRVSIDRNKDHNVAGGHAWARFTDPSNQVYIIDPAQKFVGTLEASHSNSDRWDYRRTEDLVKQLLG